MNPVRRQQRLRGEFGTVLIETIVVGFTVALVTLPILLTVVRLADASDVASSEAKAAAEWVARHGSEPPGVMRGELHIESDGESVTATATVRVDVIAIGGARVATDIHATHAVPIAPFRSDR